MKVVVDTNVFVSGVFWKGPPYQVLMAWQKKRFRLMVSQPVLEEYRRVMAELAAKYPTDRYERILELVELHSEAVPVVSFARPICKDSDDDKFLATALSAGADFLVTGDKALLELNPFRGIQILKPAAFLKQIN